MFIIKALMMTPLECIFAYRILPLLMRSWVGDRSNPKDPVVLRGGGGEGGVTVGISGWSCGAGALQPLAYSRPHSTTAKKLPFYRLTVSQKLHNTD